MGEELFQAIFGWISNYCKTLKFREHFIIAQIRESAKFAKFKCSGKLSTDPKLSGTFYEIEIGQSGAKLQHFKAPPPKKRRK